MMNDDSYERVWNALLSRDAQQVLEAFQSLDKASQQAVLTHLRRMVGEAGWHAEQRKSARAALKTIKDCS